MRIQRLDLLRYGCFSDRTLEFKHQQADIHILFGSNEAGKTTALTAIEDLLFGIPPRSPYGYLHDYGAMRIGALLQNGEEALDLRRRKGRRGQTLLDAEEVAFPSEESALLPYLTGADRTFFTRMFSLDHERLARGGREILEAKDEIGQTLFAAGSGVSGLHDQIQALKKEAEDLWAPRRAGYRTYYQALDALDEAGKALSKHTVTASAWYDMKRAFDAKQKTCAELEREIESHSAEQRRLSRIRRVYRWVHKLEEVEAKSAELGAVILLPKDAGERLERAKRDAANARSRIEELSSQHDSLKEERAQLACDETLLQRAEEIDHLHELRIEVHKEKLDLPKRRAELEKEEEKLRSLAERLEWRGKGVEALLSRVPRRTSLKAAHDLLIERGKWASRIDSAKTALEEAEGALSDLTLDLEETEEAGDVTALSAGILAAREQVDIASRIRTAEKDAKDNEAAIRKGLKPLRPQVADEQALTETPVPPRPVVQRECDLQLELEEDLRNLHQRIRDMETEIAERRDSYDAKTRDEDLVPPETLQKAREKRQTGWSLLRRRFIEEDPVTEVEIAVFHDGPESLPDAYEMAVGEADRLADRRFETAQSAGEMAAIADQIEDRKKSLNRLYEEQAELLVEKNVRDQAWAELWSEVSFEPLAPDFMLSWLDARDTVLGCVESRDRAQSELATLRKDETEAAAPIVEALAVLGEDSTGLKSQSLRVVLEAADAVRQRHEARAKNRGDLENRLRKLTAKRDQKRTALEKAKTAWRDWEEAWKAALEALELDPSATLETVSGQLETIEDMRNVEKVIKQLRHERIDKIERDITSFTVAVKKFMITTDPDLAAGDPDETVRAMEERLKKARQFHDRQIEKDKHIASVEKRIEECEAHAREARENLQALQDIVAAESPEELQNVLAKSQRKRQLESELAELHSTLTKEGDGLPLPDLRAECEGSDLDRNAAREQTLETELTELRNRLKDATVERAEAQLAFRAIGGDRRAADAAAARQEALASLRDCAELFVRVRTAGTLLQWAIDRYRRQQQTPLLKRASKMFATLTSNSFSELRVDYDEQDHARLTGIRPDRQAPVTAEGMSDGTADQLYLALRLASVKEYLSRAQSLPFIADDLFINFDDERAAAGLALLAELSQKTQVLFFTHHRHLVEIARSTLGRSVSVIDL